MRNLLAFTIGATLVVLIWTRGAWLLGRILAVPGDIDYRGKR